MATNVKKIPFTMIAYDQGTQQRQISEQTLEHYTNLMKEKVKFPPLEVVFDGRMYYLWDGFHRLFAGQAAGIKMFECNITKGTARDAVWLSFSANKSHGMPRDEQSTRDIIKRILDDEEWATKTQEEIAKHIGITQQRVSKLIAEISRQRESDITTCCDIGKKDSGSKEPENKSSISAQKQGKSAPPEDKEEIPERYILKDFSPQKRPVPERLRTIFENRAKTNEFIQRLKLLQKDIEADIKKDPLYWYFFVKGSLDTDIKNLIRQLKAAMPHAVCRFCGGTDSQECDACKGSGFLNELRFNAVPEELR